MGMEKDTDGLEAEQLGFSCFLAWLVLSFLLDSFEIYRVWAQIFNSEHHNSTVSHSNDLSYSWYFYGEKVWFPFSFPSCSLPSTISLKFKNLLESVRAFWLSFHCCSEIVSDTFSFKLRSGGNSTNCRWTGYLIIIIYCFVFYTCI
jgi:hypothetical protein